MMSQSYLVAIFTLVVLILMAAVFEFFYHRSLRSEVSDYWRQVLKKMRVRLDKIPNLIEAVRFNVANQEKTFDELIAMRTRSWPMMNADPVKVDLELEISAKIHEIWELSKKFEALAHDTNFLAMKTEFKEIGKDIEQMLDNYNEMVRHFNKSIKFIGFLPFSLLFGFRKLPIFEFES